MTKNILFIGCGYGGEIYAYPDNDSHITALEPSDNCRLEAAKRLKKRKNVELLPNSIFNFSSKTFDEIFLIFPVPVMLFRRCNDLALQILRLLKKNGSFTLYSEIWPENQNIMTCFACEKLSLLLKEHGLHVTEEILLLNELPEYVRGADFLRKATKDTNLSFRKITALRTDS